MAHIVTKEKKSTNIGIVILAIGILFLIASAVQLFIDLPFDAASFIIILIGILKTTGII
jgi:Na+/citrate or Na+/malate symporter